MLGQDKLPGSLPACLGWSGAQGAVSSVTSPRRSTAPAKASLSIASLTTTTNMSGFAIIAPVLMLAAIVSVSHVGLEACCKETSIRITTFAGAAADVTNTNIGTTFGELSKKTTTEWQLLSLWPLHSDRLHFILYRLVRLNIASRKIVHRMEPPHPASLSNAAEATPEQLPDGAGKQSSPSVHTINHHDRSSLSPAPSPSCNLPS